MAFDTEQEIIKAIKQSEDDQGLLFDRMDEDFDYAVGKKYTTEKGYEEYTSTKPQNFMDKVTDGLNRAEMSIMIKLAEDAEEKERRQASTGELFLFGGLNDIDRNLAAQNQPPLREGLGYYISCRGWYCLKCLVYERKGTTYFDVVPWDPLHVTYDYGSYGLIWIARKRRATAAQIAADYGITPTGSGGSSREPGHMVIDFFDGDRNSILIDNTFVKKPEEHKIEGIPVLHGAVGAMPTIEARDFVKLGSASGNSSSSTLEYRGLSVFSSAKHTFEPFNKLISHLMDTEKRANVGSLVHKSKGGQKKLAGDPYAHHMIIPVDVDESIEGLKMPQAPEVTAALLGILDTESQQSMLPYPLAYGGTQEPLSGRALAVLSDATRSVYSPRTAALGRCYVWLCEQMLSQYAQKGKKREFRGYKPDGKFFSAQIKPKDINKGWFVSAKVEPRMPRDMESDVQTAVMATDPRGPNGERLMSLSTAREDIIQMRDPDAERDKVLAEYGESLPPMVAMNTAAALERRGEHEAAQQVLALLTPQSPPPAGAPNGQRPPPQIPPQVVDQIARVFVEAGQEDLGMAVLEALGVELPPPSGGPPGPPPGGPGPSQPPVGPVS